MSVSWNTFEKNITDAIKGRSVKSEDDFAKVIATEYDNAVRNRAQDIVLGNRVLSTNKSALESALRSGFKIAKTTSDQSKAQNIIRTFFNTGLIAYWVGATLGMTNPPPGAASVVTNLVISPGFPPDVKVSNVSNPETFARELSVRLRTHLLTVSVLTTGVSPTGVPVILPISGLN